MPRIKKSVSNQPSLTHKISLAFMSKSYDKGLIDEAISLFDKKEQRVRLLPSHVVFYYVLALMMYPGVAAKEVLAILLDNFSLGKDFCDGKVPVKSAITKARKRLGFEPLEHIYQDQVRPIATKKSKGSFYKNLRLVAIDGTVINLPDSKENVVHFKKDQKLSPLPQARMVCLAEVGTHILFNAKIASVKDGEATLAKEVLKNLSKEMFCLADRNFFGYGCWKTANQTGASLLWRIKHNMKLPVIKRLKDGSYKSRYTYKAKGKKAEFFDLRVVEILGKSLDSTTGQLKEEIYRFVTNVLDPELLPAKDFMKLYMSRWEIETSFKELKVIMPNYSSMIRAKLPELVYQEIYALLLVHYAIRSLMHESALKEDIDPDELSFIHSFSIIKRKARNYPIFSPEEKKKS